MEAALLAVLLVIDNVLAHEGPPPPHAPAMVRELLAHPLEVQYAQTLFQRAVPETLVEFAQRAPQGGSKIFDNVLSLYINELNNIHKELQEAITPFDEAPILRRLDEGLVSADQLLRVAAAVDAARLEKVNSRFIDATLRFAHAARTATGFAPQAMQFDSPIGLVSIGTPGNDHHGPEAALIVDPGGDDFYERLPATGGAVSVIVDLGGNDNYTGSDVAVHGLSAIVDFAGDDRYAMQGPGLAAAIAGASVVIDHAGRDSYEAGYFGQGAAAFGFGALLDLEGDDRYRLRAWGQGFGAAGGTGLLWDYAGDDAYSAAGETDPYERGAGLSGAQGAAFGFRTMLGGGIGILRDDSGNDAYEADMFAQGIGFYYGIGLLWDGRGNDRYRAVRYAQGNGAHQAVGLLRDESGDDSYQLSFGVGQGMGLDLAVGVLFDGGGDDAYRAGTLAQGTATANGIGLLADGGGSDRWEINEGVRAWGHAEWYRGLPSVGLLQYSSSAASFARAGQSLAQPPAPSIAHETSAFPACGKISSEKLKKGIAELRRDHLDSVLEVGEALRCSTDWTLMEELLERDPASPLAFWVALSLQTHSVRNEKLLGQLDSHPSCGVRSAALEARGSVAAAQAALGSPCWRLQAAARAVLERR